MTPDRQQGVPGDKITIDDVKHQAEAVKELAVVQAKDAAQSVVDDNAGRTLLVMAGIAVVVASLAFYYGSRSACLRLVEDQQTL